MSRTTNSRKEETHARIVSVAARALRRHGYAGVGVAEVMKEAGLTHGGFYAHFRSREALLIEALERARRDSAEIIAAAAGGADPRKSTSAFRSFVETYLQDTQLASRDTGCPVAALGCEMARQESAVREASTASVRGLIAGVRAVLKDHSKVSACVVAATLVGSLQLARAVGDNAEGRAMLAATRKQLIQQYDGPTGR